MGVLDKSGRTIGDVDKIKTVHKFLDLVHDAGVGGGCLHECARMMHATTVAGLEGANILGSYQGENILNIQVNNRCASQEGAEIVNNCSITSITTPFKIVVSKGCISDRDVQRFGVPHTANIEVDTCIDALARVQDQDPEASAQPNVAKAVLKNDKTKKWAVEFSHEKLAVGTQLCV